MTGDEVDIDAIKAEFEVTADGRLLWRRKAKRSQIGGEAGGIMRGYRRVRIGRRSVYVHRIIFAITNGRWPGGFVDHINGDTGDNRPENLREVSFAQNSMNAKLRHDNTSGAKGVYREARTGRWMAIISANKKKFWLGFYHDKEDAKFAYDCAAEFLHREFRRTP